MKYIIDTDPGIDDAIAIAMAIRNNLDIIGFTLAIANFIKLITIDHISVIISFVVCLTLLVTIIIAKIVGCLLPLGAKKVGFDPAVMASPFITTILDTLSLVIFFKIATIILHI